MAKINTAINQPTKPQKYHATKTVVDGITFDSKREANRYIELKLLQRAGEISDLERQPEYPLLAYCQSFPGVFTGIEVGRYTADFRYRKGGSLVVEDVKTAATATTAYKLRKRIVEACHGITVVEV